MSKIIVYQTNKVNTKNTNESNQTEGINFISPRIKDFDNSSELYFKEDKFFVTRSNINKDTSINIKKIFFPNKYKKKSEILEIQNKSRDKLNETSDYMNEDYRKKKKKSKIYPINHKTITERKEFPQVKSHLTSTLNKELSRISNVYGNIKSMKKFTDNPIADRHYENNNYYAYEITKQNEFQKVNFKPKLKPLINKEKSLSKITKNLFFLNDMKKTIRKVL